MAENIISEAIIKARNVAMAWIITLVVLALFMGLGAALFDLTAFGYGIYTLVTLFVAAILSAVINSRWFKGKTLQFFYRQYLAQQKKEHEKEVTGMP